MWRKWLPLAVELAKRLPVAKQETPRRPSFGQIYREVKDEMERRIQNQQSVPIGMPTPTPTPTPIPTPTMPNPISALPSHMPTTNETMDELKRRLGKELYRMELDLLAGGRIANRPCDCLSKKHTLGIEATAEELIPMDSRRLYGDIIRWLQDHEKEFEPEGIAKRTPEHYQALSADVRRFRKELFGTETLGAMLTEDERRNVMKRVSTELGKNP